MRKLIVLTLIFITSLTILSHSQVQTQKLDSLLNALNARDLAFGRLAIAKNGTILYEKALGYAHISPSEKTTSTLATKYRIGSVSKMFTAVLIFQLVDENKITLSQNIGKYFPHLPNANEITISHLLNHQSGLHDYTKDTGFEEWMNKPKSKDELIQIIQQKELDFKPGTSTNYSNSNYLLLSYILESVTGISYEMLLTKRITSKIKLKNTYIGKSIQAKNNESTSYKFANNTWNAVKETDSGIHSGAGAITSTPVDLVVFINAVFTGKLISTSSLEKMKTITDGYGMGLFPFDQGSIKGFGHNGRIEEFYTAVRYFPDSQLSIAYCTNGINFPRTDILQGILNSCFNQPVVIPFSNLKKLTEESLVAYAGNYTSESMGLTVNIIYKNNTLSAETQGAIFELEPVSENYYRHAPSGYYFEFYPVKSTLQIKETDNVYVLTRK